MRLRLPLLLALTLAGCAARAATAPAYVDLRTLERAHPLYGTLAQYDRQIAALQATMHTGFAAADSMIDNASRAVDRTASSQQHAILPARVSPPASLASHLGAQPSAPDDIAAHITATYQQQHSALQGAAQGDMRRYRDALAAQQQSAYDAFVASVNASSQRAVELRAQELRERESNLLLELARQHAQQRLSLRTKLQALMLRPEQRAPLLHALAALQAQEDASLAAARRRDLATLSAYRASVSAHAFSEIAAFRSDLETRAAANLAARERVLAAQSQSPASLALPSTGSQAASAADTATMQAQYNDLANASPPTPDFGPAASDLRSNWQALRRAHDDDTAHTASQIADLQHDRDAARKKIDAQIMTEATRIARAQGYAGAVDGRGSPDITRAVTADLRNLLP